MKSLKIVAVVFLSLLIIGCGDKNGNGNGEKGNPEDMNIDLDSYTLSPLTEEQKYALAHMWNEERLAYDIYMNLNKVHPAKQLENIATRSEVKHISLVRDLVAIYDINITNYLDDYSEHYSKGELDAMPSGVYGIPAIQNLYNDLYAEGVDSLEATLKVGCKVEVVDVDDLLKYLETSIGNQALIDTFTILLEGSYKHYWAFDKGLKNNGVGDGCCSLGADFCKTSTEYPSS